MTDPHSTFVGNPLCEKCMGRHPVDYDCRQDVPSLTTTIAEPTEGMPEPTRYACLQVQTALSHAVKLRERWAQVKNAHDPASRKERAATLKAWTKAEDDLARACKRAVAAMLGGAYDARIVLYPSERE